MTSSLNLNARKLRGDPPEVPVTARPCVGLCYLMRLRGIEMETTTRKPKRPCIGICYLQKTGKLPKAKEDTDAAGEDEEEEAEEEEGDYEEDEGSADYEDSGDFSGDYEEDEK